MKPDKCNHEVTFVTSLFVTNPYNYPCPHCQKRLTLDKTGRRFVLATATTATLYASIIGTLSFMAVLDGTPMLKVVAFNLLALALGCGFLLPMLYIGWKRSRSVERTKLDSARQKIQRKERPTQERPPFRYRPIFGLSNG